MMKGKPFVKWAGGKRQIISELKKYVPETFNTYYEPFIGGGALLFELAPEKAVINDYNTELINVYRVLCDETKFKKMCSQLNKYETSHSEEFYYEIRNKDKNKQMFSRLADYTRAARTIYLNKTCFNGLYRVNSKNEFNVPSNKKAKVNTYDSENLLTVNMYLTFNKVEILNGDYEQALKNVQKGDFVYFDPPFDSDTKTFTNYTDIGFGKEEQRRLADVFKTLDEKGAYVMLSNHNTVLINELYQDYHIHIIKAKRNINSKSSGRGKIEEVIITNYEPNLTFENQE